MKLLLNFLFLATLLAAIAGCKDSDPCKDKNCGHGTCNDGTCDCDPGYMKDADGNCTLAPCDGVDCVHGTCNDGLCTCDPGYEKDALGQCTVVTRDRFLGTYQVSEDCSNSLPFNYTTTLVAGAATQEVYINNFWGAFINPVKATVVNDTLFIARQAPDNDDYFVEGNGVYNKNGSVVTIQLSYQVRNESVVPFEFDVCTNTVYVKQ